MKNSKIQLSDKQVIRAEYKDNRIDIVITQHNGKGIPVAAMMLRVGKKQRETLIETLNSFTLK